MTPGPCPLCDRADCDGPGVEYSPSTGDVTFRWSCNPPQERLDAWADGYLTLARALRPEEPAR